MYQFKEVDKEIVNKFNMESNKGHVFQTSYWADVKEEWSSRYIGGFDGNGEIVLASMIILRRIPYVNRYMGYIPRGFTCDYQNRELLKEFTSFLREYGKKNRIAFITIDPDIHLKENEEAINYGEEIRESLLKLGYINKKAENFENIQPNFVFRLDIDGAEEGEEKKKRIFNNFTSKTRYNIKVAQDRGLTVEAYDKNNINDDVLEEFHKLMVITGKRDNFITRPKKYFGNMIDKMYPYCRLYMVKYDYNKDFERINEKLTSQLKNKERLEHRRKDTEEKLNQEKDADKLDKLLKKLKDIEKNISEAERQISSFNVRIKEIEEFKDKGQVYVSGAIYLYYGDKGWYLYGASHNILRDTMPNFLMQWSMIEDSIALGCSIYDFRGVSGDLNPENPLYGLYKFKKGFSGKFVEFIGEFELVIDKNIYRMFKYALPKFKAIRAKLRRRK